MIKCLLIANTSKVEQSLVSALYYSITLNLSVKRKVVDKVPDMLFWYNFLTFITSLFTTFYKPNLNKLWQDA